MRRTIIATVLLATLLNGANALATGICSTDGVNTITCDNPETGGYATWKVGKDTAASRVFACALVSGNWTLVGYETYSDEDNLQILGCGSSETVTVVDSASETCDAGSGATVGQIPSDWFVRIEVQGYRGDDTITGSYRDEDLRGGTGADTIDGRSGGDDIYGGSENDDIWGGPGIDVIDGDSGSDEIHGGDNGDTIDGGDGIDYLYGDAHDDTITGGEDRDWMYGGTGADTIDGNDDLVIDMIYGEGGDDILEDDAGSCVGGADYDTCVCAYEDCEE